MNNPKGTLTTLCEAYVDDHGHVPNAEELLAYLREGIAQFAAKTTPYLLVDSSLTPEERERLDRENRT